MSETIVTEPTPMRPRETDFWLTTIRALIGRCPNCGQGHLFRKFLKPVDHCAVCGEAFGHIRADDGPAWLTILIVGHVLGPVLLHVIPNSDWPDWVSMIVWPVVAVAMSLLCLPRAKGVFIAMIWRTGSRGSEL